MKTLKEAAIEYRTIAKELRAMVKEKLPFHSVVHDGQQHVIVFGYNDAPEDKVVCLFENMNTWFRNVEDLTVIEDKTEWPEWIRKFLLGQLPGRVKQREREYKEASRKEYEARDRQRKQEEYEESLGT